MAVTFKDWVEYEAKANAPFEAAWLAWYEGLSPEQRAEYHTGTSLGAESPPPEPVRSYRAALLREIMSCR